MLHKTFSTRIFLDGGDPIETQLVLQTLGFLDGQTTNPTLVAKSPGAQTRLLKGEKFTQTEIWEFYKKMVQDVSKLLPNGSISIEVYADTTTTAEEMLEQAKNLYAWIPNAHIKFPITNAGLEAASEAVKQNMNVNMTLCFTQAQAAAVYAATKGAARGQVFISPFIGRLDDQGENGMDLIANILKMYKNGDGHVEVLSASIRTPDHMFETLRLKTDIITVPFKILQQCAKENWLIKTEDFVYDSSHLKPIGYEECDLDQPWQIFNIQHPLTSAGIERFAADWNNLLK